MDISLRTSIHDLLENYPFLEDFFVEYNPTFSLLRNKAMRATLGRMATIEHVATIGGINAEILLKDIKKEIEIQTMKESVMEKESKTTDDSDLVDGMKRIIEDLHKGVPLDEARKRFSELTKDISAEQIAKMEEQLITEGMPVSEVQRLCDVHVGVFKEALDKHVELDVPKGHPVHTYLIENRLIIELTQKLNGILGNLELRFDLTQLKPELSLLLTKLSGLDNHYIRKENQLFPFLEKHGVTGPSQVMWGVHDEIRDMIKALHTALENSETEKIVETGFTFVKAVNEVVYKENKILFPMALQTLSQDEWAEIRHGEDELGYALAEPEAAWPEGGYVPKGKPAIIEQEGLIQLRTGQLTAEQLNTVLINLPVDITFVDADGYVRYYSDSPERIFPRSPGIIGRHVEKCHPPESLHKVRQIIDAFKSGKKDVAEFWIELQGRFIHIRYFALHDEKRNFVGTLEVSQDITEIRKLQGQQRLLDWTD